MDNIWSSLITRVALGVDIDLFGVYLPDKVTNVLSKIQRLQQDLNKQNVYDAVNTIYPGLFKDVFKGSSKELSSIVRQKGIKDKLFEVYNKIQKELISNKDDDYYDWDKLLKKLNYSLALGNATSKNFLLLGDVSWGDDEIVCSFGYPVLDRLIEGGVARSSFTIFYAQAGAGKSTIVTRQLACSVIKQGKRPLIVSLEGDPARLQKRILMQLCGLSTKDPRSLTQDERELVNNKAKEMPPIPIINSHASTRFELDRLISSFNPDIIIYDQITIGAKSRDWKDIANTSEMLKKVSLDTGIPVIALTQSDKRFNDPNIPKDENNDEVEDMSDIKYAQAIREDALTVIKICDVYPKHPMKRRLVIEKTKDDELSRRLPIKIDLEWTPHGMVETHVEEGRKRISAEEFIINNSRIPQVIEEKIEPVVESSEISAEKSSEKPVIENTGKYDNNTYLATGERLANVGKELGIKELISLADTWNNTIDKELYDKKFISDFKYDINKHKYYNYYGRRLTDEGN